MSKRKFWAAALLVVAGGVGGAWPLAAHAQVTESVAGRFVANGDEVTDKFTGLVWRRCSEGQTWTGSTCAGEVVGFNWQSALERARSAAADGIPWRLPNVKELSSLVDDSRFDPSVDTTAFPGTPVTTFWTSTHLFSTYGLIYTWAVDFSRGSANYTYRGYGYAVRLVRTGP